MGDSCVSFSFDMFSISDRCDKSGQNVDCERFYINKVFMDSKILF